MIHFYPLTATAFLVGSLAIAGFPPFNGFISEWLTLQTLIAGLAQLGGREDMLLMLVFILALAGLGAAFSLTALAFVKIAGETVLGAPRHAATLANAKKGEAPLGMLLVIGSLASLCLLLGILPAQVLRQLAAIPPRLGLPPLDQVILYDQAVGFWLQIPTPVIPYSAGLSSFLLLSLAGGVGLSILISLLRKTARRLPSPPVWSGGVRFDPQTMQYSSTALSALIWGAFARQRQPLPNVQLEQDALPAHLPVDEKHYVLEIFANLYNRLLSWLLRSSTTIGNRVQSGDIRSYLLYILVTLVGALLLLLVRSALQSPS